VPRTAALRRGGGPGHLLTVGQVEDEAAAVGEVRDEAFGERDGHGLARAGGTVELADDAAVALWLSVEDELELPIPDYEGRLLACVGAAYLRFVTLDEATNHRHPPGVPHDYLAYLAVRPARQGHGYGSALLRYRHARLDAEHRPAYLEATGPRSRVL